MAGPAVAPTLTTCGASFVLAMVLLVVAGCAPRWTKPGMTRAEFERDAAECARRADVLDPPLFPYGGGNLAIGPLIWLPKPAFSPRSYRACMQGLGYRWERPNSSREGT